MDPSIYLQYSPPNGLPQESKLATYMNHSTVTPTRSLNQAMSKLSIEASPTSSKKPMPMTISGHVPQQQQLIPHPQPPPIMTHIPPPHLPPQALLAHPPPQVLIGEFVPINYYTHTPSHALIQESPQSSPPTPMPMPMPVTTQVHQENVGGTTYFYSTNADSLNASAVMNTPAAMGPDVMGVGVPVASPYASQMYAGPTSHASANHKSGLAQAFYMPETIREEIYQRAQDVFLQHDPMAYPDIPEVVDRYAELVPLEATGAHALATSYRATHRRRADHVALRRLHACVGAAAPGRVDMWKQLDHPNIVRLQQCFTTKAFGDHSLVLVYDYHPACITMLNKYLGGAGGDVNGFMDPFSSDPDAPRPYTHQKNAMLRAVATGQLLPEAMLWSMLVQLTSALRAIHSHGLACRTLEPSKVIVNGCRLRISWPGIADAMHNGSFDVIQAQQEDLVALGRLILSLACRTVHCDNINACMDLVARTYSMDLKNMLMYLLTPSPNVRRTITDIMPMIGARFFTQVEALERRSDAFEEQLVNEIDNGRLLRILIKLGIINERPELNMDTSWSETGDRYMLKLFRDHIFHSVTPDGRPWLDRAHVAAALNNLDGGNLDKVELMSRDEQSVLVVSYAELKHCLENAYEEVMAAAAGP
ncbi:unnamed protein product [Danaus chrysippus]|uniref:PAN2-PAN3 deadenylation complex subunit PAN3 n=1 Tax=Danaus chrysippus TaxID=151541 RepID=A0A8J2MIJ8_9NEOP|nr:unnamed protein product [Danaus chrysippus]